MDRNDSETMSFVIELSLIKKFWVKETASLRLYFYIFGKYGIQLANCRELNNISHVGFPAQSLSDQSPMSTSKYFWIHANFTSWGGASERKICRTWYKRLVFTLCSHMIQVIFHMHTHLSLFQNGNRMRKMLLSARRLVEIIVYVIIVLIFIY